MNRTPVRLITNATTDVEFSGRLLKYFPTGSRLELCGLWCSGGFEIKCGSGQTLTAEFAKDCCERQIMVWHAWQGKGLLGEAGFEAAQQRLAQVK